MTLSVCESLAMPLSSATLNPLSMPTAITVVSETFFSKSACSYIATTHSMVKVQRVNRVLPVAILAGVVCTLN